MVWYELLVKRDHGEPWSEKGGVLEKQKEMVNSFKDSYKTLLTFFNKHIEMF